MNMCVGIKCILQLREFWWNCSYVYYLGFGRAQRLRRKNQSWWASRQANGHMDKQGWLDVRPQHILEFIINSEVLWRRRRQVKGLSEYSEWGEHSWSGVAKMEQVAHINTSCALWPILLPVYNVVHGNFTAVFFILDIAINLAVKWL